MEFTLGEIQGMKEPLSRLLTERVPMILGFRLSKLAKVFEAELTVIEEQRIKLIKELGEPVDGQEGDFGIPPNRVPEFKEQFGELLKETVEVDFEPLKISMFMDTDITASDMYTMEKLFTE